MTARAGMANPILRLRNLAQVGTADYTVGTVAYWTDNQLQDVLDSYRTDVWREALTEQATYDSGGTARYYDYYMPPGDDGAAYEEGTPNWNVVTSLGSSVFSTVTPNYRAGHVSFGTVDQAGTAYYINARRYDLNAAAADIWRAKAANVAAYYDFTADGQSMSRSQMRKGFLEMAAHYGGQAAPVQARMRRSDEP